MSTERDKLAEIIMSPESFDGGPASCGPNDVYAARTADAVLAAGYRKPQQVTTPQEVDALPEGTVIRDASGTVRERFNDPATDAALWFRSGIKGYVLSGQFASGALLPATVLHRGAE